MQNAESIKENLSETSYLRMSDLKKLFPVSVGTLYNWSKKGIIKPIKITGPLGLAPNQSAQAPAQDEENSEC